MNYSRTSTHNQTLDELLTVLADYYCRSLLWHFQHSPGEVYETSNLATKIAQQEGEEADRVATQLRHSTLPRLEDADVIEHDPRTNTARYQGHSDLETLLEAIVECQPAQYKEVEAD